MANMPMLLDAQLAHVLSETWASPYTTRSNFARLHTDLIAEAACQGLITVKTQHHEWGRTWRITSTGLALLEAQAAAPPQGELL